jgi:hypothetical protein
MAALRHATIVLPDDDALTVLLERLSREQQAVEETDHGPAVRDPSGNQLVLATA